MELNKPRIMLLIKDLQAVGGAQLNALRLASQLKQSGFQVMLMGYGDHRTIKQHLSRFNISSEIPIYPIAPFSAHFFGKLSVYWPNIFFVLPCFYKLWKNRRRFDIVHGPLLMESGLVCALSSILIGKPSIVKIGSAGKYGDVKRALRVAATAIRRMLFRRITKFVCLTKEIEDELVKELYVPSDKLVRIPNGVDIQRFKPADPQQRKKIRENMGIMPDEKVILFVGRLELKKRVDFLLKAWQAVQSDRNTNERLLIVGEGRLHSELKQLTEKLKIDKKVTFFGESDNVIPLMQAADLFVLPSVSEGLANVFLESMAVALPIVATNTIGNCEILKHKKNAVLFEEENIQDLSNAILYLLQNEEVAGNLGQSARRYVKEHFNLNNIVIQYAELYNKLAIRQT